MNNSFQPIQLEQHSFGIELNGFEEDNKEKYKNKQNKIQESYERRELELNNQDDFNLDDLKSQQSNVNWVIILKWKIIRIQITLIMLVMLVILIILLAPYQSSKT